VLELGIGRQRRLDCYFARRFGDDGSTPFVDDDPSGNREEPRAEMLS
jgi:hypothetical protein